MFRLSQLFLFSIIVLFLFISSLLMRCGYNFLTSATNTHGAFGLFNCLYNESIRVFEQISVNTFYSELAEIEGLERLRPIKLLDAVGLTEGMEISPSQSTELFSYLKSYPWVESYTVQSLVLPKRIKIKVKEATPAFVVEFEGDSWLMSTRGVLIEPLSKIDNPEVILEASSLPRLYDQDKSVEGEERTTLSTTSQRFKVALKTLEYFELAGGIPFKFSTVKILPYGELLLEVVDGAPAKEVIVSAHSFSEAKIKIAQLSSIISDIEARAENASQIDLRYQGQAIVR